MLHKLIKGLAPVAAIALSAAVAGCGDMDIKINGEEGVPLSELDMSGDPPTELVLAGPDKVVVSEGDTLDIDVTGDADAIDLVRFSLKDGTLAVSRKSGEWKNAGTAIVNVTMPAPRSIVIAGSGSVEAATLADDADLTIAGSGSLDVAAISGSMLEITVAGSGSVTGTGAVERLEMNIVGAGSANLEGLKADRAEVTVAGSGDATFASDGNVEANIVGSGDVRVIGSATCEISAMGSGTLRCEPAAAVAEPAE